MNLYFHVPSCSTAQDPQENEAHKKLVACILCLCQCSKIATSHQLIKQNQRVSDAHSHSHLDKIKKGIASCATCTERKRRRKENYFTCQMPCYFTLGILPVHHSSSSITDFSASTLP
jgi:hypothetical protein